jgi:hypothetical protein
MKKFRQQISLLLMTTLIGGACIAQSFDGYALYNLQNNNTAYLIDENGDIAHSWSCNVSCNYSVLLKENGNIVRGGYTLPINYRVQLLAEWFKKLPQMEVSYGNMFTLQLIMFLIMISL